MSAERSSRSARTSSTGNSTPHTRPLTACAPTGSASQLSPALPTPLPGQQGRADPRADAADGGPAADGRTYCCGQNVGPDTRAREGLGREE